MAERPPIEERIAPQALSDEPGPPAEPGAPAAPPPPARRRWWRIAAWGVPVLVLVAGGLALGIYLYVLSNMTVGTGEAAAGRRNREAFGWPLRLTDRVNVLLIGIDVTLDNRRQVINVARADTLVLVSFDPHGGRLGALSIPRDTRVEIPRHGVTKINASYAYGGPRLTVRTVERFLGVRVDYYIKLGPDSFARMVDALGGIEIDVEKDMHYTDSWAGFTVDLKKGRQRLNGNQVAGYIRFRQDPLGDIGRVNRQHQVIMALVRELRQPRTVLAGPRLLDAFARNTQTDLTRGEIVTLGVFALRARGAPLRVETLPGSFAPLYWEPDPVRIRAVVADLFYGLGEEDLKTQRVEVVNASGVPGLGQRVALRMGALGFRTVAVRAESRHADATVVIDNAGRPHVARAIAHALGGLAVREEAPQPGGAIVVLLAPDAAARLPNP